MKYLLLLIPSVTLATGGHDTPVPIAPPTQTQAQNQNQYQSQGQSQSANSASGASAGASAQAVGGAGGNATSQASNAGNQQTVVTERSAPALGQGSFAIQGCGVAGNAGHSGVGGASFLGFGFTPSQCYDFQLAAAYAAMGATRAACDVLNLSPAGQRAKKRGVNLPVCDTQPVAIPSVPVNQPTPPVVVNVQPSPPPPPQACTKALRQCVRK